MHLPSGEGRGGVTTGLSTTVAGGRTRVSSFPADSENSEGGWVRHASRRTPSDAFAPMNSSVFNVEGFFSFLNILLSRISNIYKIRQNGYTRPRVPGLVWLK